MAPEEQKEVAVIERFLGRTVARVMLPDFDYKMRPAEYQQAVSYRDGTRPDSLSTPKPAVPRPAPAKPATALVKPSPAGAKPAPAPVAVKPAAPMAVAPAPKPVPAKPVPARSVPAKLVPAKLVPAKLVPAKPAAVTTGKALAITKPVTKSTAPTAKPDKHVAPKSAVKKPGKH
jgi:hypothetical protein